MPDEKVYHKTIPLTGKLITADPASIGQNFQTLQNLRPTDTHVKGIQGMTKINANPLAGYLKVRNAFHFKKSQPAESHVLVQAYNTGLTGSQVLQNATAIPSTGDFNELMTLNVAATPASFADGATIHGNTSAATCVIVSMLTTLTYLVKSRSGTFTLGEVLHDGTNSADQGTSNPTFALSALLTDTTVALGAGRGRFSDAPDGQMIYANGVDTCIWGGDETKCGAVIASTVALSAPTDTATSPKDYTDQVNNTKHDSANIFTCGGSYLTFLVGSTRPAKGATFYFDSLNTTAATLTIKESTAGVWNTITPTSDGTCISPDTTTPFAQNGKIVWATTVATTKPKYLEGYYCYWYQFTMSAGSADIYHITLDLPFQPIIDMWDGIYRDILRFYVYTSSQSDQTLNVLKDDYDVTSASTYADISSLVATTQYLETGFGEKQTGLFFAIPPGYENSHAAAIAAQGTITMTGIATAGQTFTIDDHTFTWAATRTVHGTVAVGANQAAAVTNIVTAVTADLDTVTAVDGTGDTVVVTSVVTGTAGNSIDFADVDSANCAFDGTGHLGATTAGVNAGLASVDYWNGSAYATVGTISDGTATSGVSLTKSGVMSWNNTSLASEQKKQYANAIPLYYYRTKFDQDLDASVRINYIGGINASKEISHFKFPVFAQGRVLLCADMSEEKNKAVCSAKYMPQVYNGIDSVDIYFGEEGELTCGTELFSQYGSSLYSLILMFKDNETWIMAGQDIDQWENNIFLLSSSIGCPAPLTLKTINLAAEPGAGINRSLAIWQGANGIYMSDGRAPIPIHGDIKELFDPTDSRCITASKIGDSIGWIDPLLQEYHWLSDVGEWVYDIHRNRWWEAERVVDLQCGVLVHDTDGNAYNYGFLDTGYMERLENGTTFDGNDIVHTLQFGDMALADLAFETRLSKVKLIVKAKTTTTTVSCTHYANGCTTGATAKTMSPARSGHRIAMPEFTHRLNGLFHSLKFVSTADTGTIIFEPLAVASTHGVVRED